MRKYYISHIDFSEIVNVTADPAQLETARKRMKELGLLTEKGNPSPATIGAAVNRLAPPFFSKLGKRISRRPGGIDGVYETLQDLYERREYVGYFLYIVFLYGFIEWLVPEQIALMPASPETLKVFCTTFTERFSAFRAEKESEDGAAHDRKTDI